MLDRFRSRAYSVLTSAAGDGVPPLRWTKAQLRRANDLAGRPLASIEELDDRREFERMVGGEAGAPEPEPASTEEPEAAPVVVYHLEKHRRKVDKIREVLDDEGIPYRVLDIEDDEAAQSAVKRDSDWPLPVVFIAGTPVGRAQQLINLAKSGELQKMVFGG